MRTPSSIFRGFCLLTLVAFSQHPGSVQAAPLSAFSDLTVSGEWIFDDGYAAGVDSVHSGSVGAVIGGAPIPTVPLPGAPYPAGPTSLLSADLDAVGDNFGMMATSSVTGAAFAVGVDLAVDVTNTSATSSYELVFRLTFDHTVNADLDAYSSSLIALGLDPFDATGFSPSEIFASTLLSDTLFGDFSSPGATSTPDADPPGFGDTLSEAGMFTFSIPVAPMASSSLFGFFQFEGEEFTFTDGLAFFDAGLDLTLLDVIDTTPSTPVPLPSGLLLFFSALMILLRYRPKR